MQCAGTWIQPAREAGGAGSALTGTSFAPLGENEWTQKVFDTEVSAFAGIIFDREVDTFFDLLLNR